jgi:ABC-type glycerol-3-phosphate transport system permease component
MRSSSLLEVLRAVVIVFALILSLSPVIVMLLSSFKTTTEVLLTIPPTFWPKHFVLENYPAVFEIVPFARYMLNSFLVAIPATLLAMSCASLAAYSFSRLRFPLSGVLFLVVLAAQMMPGSSLVIPTFDLLRKLGLRDNLLGLVIIYASIALPLSTWMLYGYFKSIPREIEDAALIDGCNRGQIFVRVAFPLVAPGLAAVGMFTFLVSWNEFVYALVLMNTTSHYTISVGLARFMTEYSTYYNRMGAGSIIASLPVLIMYVLTGRYLISGLMAGAVKG